MTDAVPTAGRGAPAFDRASGARLTGRRAAGVWIVVALDVALVLSLFVPGDFPLLTLPMILVVVVSLGGVGAITSTRLPWNPVGWILWVTGFVVAASLAGSTYATESVLRFDGTLPLTVAVAVVSQMTIIPTLGLVGAFLPLLFPTGRLPSPRWRGIARACAASVLLATLIEVVTPGLAMGGSGIVNPLGIEALVPVADVLGLVQTLALAIPCVIAIASVVVRYRGAGADERQQLKWFGWAGVVLLVSQLVGSSNLGPLAEWGWILDVGGLAFLPIAVGIAILRYRLYDLDRIVSRTISWAVVSALLVGVFALAVVGLQGVLAPLTQNNTIAVAGSTLVAAAVFQPLRGRVQRAVDWRFDRARYDGARTVDAFAERVRNEVDMGILRASLADAATEAVRPVSAATWLRGGTR